MLHETLYKKDSKGLTRVWFLESEGDSYRTHAGLLEGKLAVSEWTVAVPRSRPTAEEQAAFEVQAEYTKKRDRGYADELGERKFSPMLAHKYEGWTGPGYSQPKLDGIRCIATKDGLFSRQGKPIVAVPHIWDVLAPEFEKYPDLILDGELYNHDLKDDFNTITSLVRKQKPTDLDLAEAEQKIQYWVYDLPIRDECFSYRSEVLEQVIDRIGGPVKLVDTDFAHDQEQLDELYAEYLADGFEGQMVRFDGPYEQKRSKLLLKRKEFLDAEFPLIRIEEGIGNWSGVAKKVTCQLSDGREFGAGIRGTRDRAKELLGETYDSVTVRYFALTPDGVPRFPVVTAFHQGERL